MVKKMIGAVGLAGFVSACNVSPAPGSTGGVSSPDGGVCGSGVAIVTTDYTSTNIVVSKLDGTTVSGSFVSSGATKPGLSLALSGDVDIPFVAPAGNRVLLIDRYGANVLTWMDLSTSAVLAQLAVGTGFEANPHDYLDVDPTHAFVSRYGTNPTPGAQPFDQGGDLLILDTAKHAITGRIAIAEENAALQPCPDGMNWLGSEVVVNLNRWAPDFSQLGDGRFIGVSPKTNAVEWKVDVTGLQDCGRVVVSPSGKLAAIACSSMENTTTNQYDPTKSDIVVYDATVTPPKELRRLGVGVKLGAGVQATIAFASEDAILALTYGGNATPGDTAFTVSATTGKVTQLAQATKPYVLSGMHCAPGCGDVCLVSDTESDRLRRWHVAADGTFTPLSDDVVDTVVGLPPHSIGNL